METRHNIRRTMPIGFSTQRDAEGQMQGQVVMRFARRNAYELIGLRRPAREQLLRPRGC